jgi:hypothetical protein
MRSQGEHTMTTSFNGFASKIMTGIAAAALIWASAPAARASSPASDNACSSAYSGGGNYNGLNGGAGFGPWQVIPSGNGGNSGAFIGNSGANGGGGGPGINCSPGTKAWGLYANNGAQATALRPFTSGNLLVGQSVTLEMDNGFINGPYSANNVVELQLMNASGQMRFGFHFRGGAGDYQVFDASNGSFERGTGIGFTDGGIRLVFTLTGTDTYSLQVIRLAGGSTTLTGTLGGPGGTGIDRVFCLVRNAGSGSAFDAFFNNFAISCNGQPPAPSAGSNGPICEGQTLNLTASSTAPGAQYFWTGPNGFASTLQSPSIVNATTNASGTYSVTVVSGGCTSSAATVSVNVYANPSAPVAGNNGPICEGQSLQLTASGPASGPNVVYQWVGPGGFSSNDQNPVIPNASTANAGTYFVTVTINGCPSPQGSTTASVNVSPACAISGPASVCPGASAAFSGPSGGSLTYAWSVTGNGTISGPADGPTVTVDAGADGSYTVSLTVSENGCSRTCTQVVAIDSVPPTITCGAPTLLNSGFEAGGPCGSQVINNWAIFGNGYHECSTPRSGSFFAKTFGNWNGNPDYTGLFQDLPAAAGQTWRASVYAMVPNNDVPQNGSYGKIRIEFLNASFGFISGADGATTVSEQTPKDIYVKLVVTATAPAGTAYVRIVPTFVQLNFAGGAVFFDDASLTRLTVVSADASCLAAIPDVTSLATASDNNPGVTVTQSPAPGTIVGLGNHTVTLTATDACGHSSQCTLVVTVVDDTAPALSCPADTTVECDASTAPADTGSATATDNCSVMIPVVSSDSVAAGSCGQGSVITRRWTAIDTAGNLAQCVQTITRQDTTGPVLSGIPSNLAVQCAADLPAAPAPARAWALYANSGALAEAIRTLATPLAVGQKVILDLDTGFIDAGGTVGFGLRNSLGENRFEVFFNGGEATYRVKGSGSSVASTIGYTGEGLHIEFTQTGADTFSVTLVRLQSGHAQTLTGTLGGTAGTAIDRVRFFNFNSGAGTSKDAFYNNVEVPGAAFDSASDAAYSDGWQNGDNGGYGWNGGWLLNPATDGSTAGSIIGNSAANDGGDSNGDGDINSLSVRAADNCDPHVNVAYSQTDNNAAGCAGQPRVIVRTWTATDDCGNTTTQSQTITQEDTEGPALSGVPAHTSVQCAGDVPAPAVVTAWDACSGAAAVQFNQNSVSGTVVRTWSATDACGNTASATQVITVDDTIAPVLTCPSDVTIECTASTDPSNTGSATATDNCDASPAIAYSDSSAAGACGQASTITRTWTATDDEGNVSSCVQTITVVDSIPPVLAIPADLTIECDADSSPAATGQASASDNCDGSPSVTYADAEVPGSCPNSRVITRTWTATDDCGNSASASQTITVQDTTAPAATVSIGSANVLLNAGFESGNGPGGQVIQDWGSFGPGTYHENFAPHGGQFHAKVFGGGGNNPDYAGWFQDHAASAGETWRASVFAYLPSNDSIAGNDNEAKLRIEFFDANDAFLGGQDSLFLDRNTPQDTHILLSVTMTAPAGTTRVRIVPTFIQNDFAGGAVFFDDARLEVVQSSASAQCLSEVPPADASLVHGQDNCDTATTVLHLGDVVAGGNGCAADPIVVTRTFRVSDDCGNAADVAVTINVADTVAPSLVGVPADATAECGAIPAPATVTATDNCDSNVPVVLVESASAGSCAGGYTITRTWTATDACGNSATATQTITVQDTAAPQVTASIGSANVLLNASFESGNGPGGQVIQDWSPFGNVFHENFDPRTGQFHAKVFGTGAANPDFCGLFQDAAASAGQVWRASVYAHLPSDDSIAGNGNQVKLRLEFFDGSNALVGAQDSHLLDGSSAQDQHILLSVTMAAPAGTETVRIVPTFIQHDNASGAVYFDDARLEVIATSASVQCVGDVPPADLGLVQAQDGCDAFPSVTHIGDVSNGGAGCASDPEIITRTFRATDACGNASDVSVTITVADTIAPVLGGVPADTTVECGNIPAAATVTALDNCDASVTVAMVETVDAGSCASGYSITRTWTATDDCGNSSTASQVITVQDSTAPVIAIIGGAATVECHTSYVDAGATATDNCDTGVTVTVSGAVDVDVPGAYTLTYTATDDCGNSATATRTVTVADTIAPVITVNGGDTTIECHSVYADDGASADDACDGSVAVTLSGSVDADVPGTYTITYTATDASGNSASATRTVTVVDTAAPVISVIGGDITVECHTSYADAGATADDACEGAVAVTASGAVNVNVPGTYTISYTATDSAGNSAGATRTVTVVDTTAPSITINGGNATVECHTSYSDAGASADDACDAGVGVTQSGSVDVNVPGTYTITYTSTDASGNSASAVRTVTVVDTAAPVINVIGGDATVECHTGYTDAGATADDACEGNVTVTASGTVDVNVPGTYTVTYTATDAAGNTATATRTVTVVDTVAPVITVIGGNTTVECHGVYADAGATADDACEGPVAVSTSGSVDVNVPGTYTVTYTAIDAAGNAATATRTVAVVDTTAPTIVCPANQVITQTNCAGGVVFVEPTASDNCDGNVTVTCVPASGAQLGPGTHTIVCTATDDAGNSSSCSFTVTVVSRLQVVFEPQPLSDDNVDDNIETDQDVKNTFKAGSKIPHKIKLFDCAGNDVTLAVASQVTVKLNVTQRQYVNATTSTLVNDVPENYTGVGGAGGVMELTGGFFHYNLNTSGYPAGTVNNPTFFRSHVTVEYNTAPGTVVGEEDALLESK